LNRLPLNVVMQCHWRDNNLNLLFCKETHACFARFFTFSSKLQMYVLLHIVTMNGHSWIFLPNFAVVLIDEIMEDDIPHLNMTLSNCTHLDIRINEIILFCIKIMIVQNLFSIANKK
jgi:hypothetical protein